MREMFHITQQTAVNLIITTLKIRTNYTGPKTEKVGNISLLKRDRIALQYS